MENSSKPYRSKQKRRRRRNRNKKKALGEECKGLEMEEARVSVQDLQNTRQTEKRLKRDEIYPLRKVPANSHGNPGALYTCALCDIPLESIPHAFKHIRDKRHKKRAREKQEQLMLTEILPPGPEHISAVTAALKAVVQEHGMNDQDVLKRESVVSVMQDFLLSSLPGDFFCNIFFYLLSCMSVCRVTLFESID
uniref:Terminal uridylyltransferase 4/7 nucleotidyltransferase domain-containing protein n=1 Tax=Xiphophorus maculatus TaxID=8083 RepID=A0A3B5R987_XIPMA